VTEHLPADAMVVEQWRRTDERLAAHAAPAHSKGNTMTDVNALRWEPTTTEHRVQVGPTHLTSDLLCPCGSQPGEPCVITLPA
jgi:hypothetical protein